MLNWNSFIFATEVCEYCIYSIYHSSAEIVINKVLEECVYITTTSFEWMLFLVDWKDNEALDGS